MKLSPTALPEVWLVSGPRHADARGSFERLFCAKSFGAAGLPVRFVQSSLATNTHRGTLRGLHWQAPPAAEGKLVRCIAGAVYDVAVDLRDGSATRYRWVGLELSAANGDALFIPPGFAHGYQALEDGSAMLYNMTEPYAPGLARGARWNDPALAIAWPLPDPILSARDATFPNLPPR